MPKSFWISVLVLALSSCAGLEKSPISYAAKASLEKFDRDNTKDLLDPIKEQYKTIAASQRFIMEEFSSMRQDFVTYRNTMFNANRQSDKLHQKWERKFLKLEKHLMTIDKVLLTISNKKIPKLN